MILEQLGKQANKTQILRIVTLKNQIEWIIHVIINHRSKDKVQISKHTKR